MPPSLDFMAMFVQLNAVQFNAPQPAPPDESEALPSTD